MKKYKHLKYEEKYLLLKNHFQSGVKLDLLVEEFGYSEASFSAFSNGTVKNKTIFFPSSSDTFARKENLFFSERRRNYKRSQKRVIKKRK